MLYSLRNAFFLVLNIIYHAKSFHFACEAILIISFHGNHRKIIFQAPESSCGRNWLWYFAGEPVTSRALFLFFFLFLIYFFFNYETLRFLLNSLYQSGILLISSTDLKHCIKLYKVVSYIYGALLILISPFNFNIGL